MNPAVEALAVPGYVACVTAVVDIGRAFFEWGDGLAAPSEAGRCALAIAFVFGPSGQDCGGIHAGKLL